MLGLLTIVAPLASEAHADTFEFLTYTPPSGWTKQATKDGIAYKRASGIGLISFYASYPATGSASDEFAKMWRARVEPTIPGAAPQPQIERVGDYTAAIGNQSFRAQEGITIISLVAVIGQGRALGVLVMATGDEAIREVTAFLDSIDTAQGWKNTTVTPTPPGSTLTGDIEVDFVAPPGYTSRREGGMIVLTPAAINDNTPCVYGISPARLSKGSLEMDARAALLEPLPGWQIKDEGYGAMRGTAGAGWKYFWFRAMVQGLVGGSYQHAYAMAMAFPAAGHGRVNIVWGFGPVANPSCQLDDAAFVRLFHSLRPRGWTSDGGRAFAQELQGVVWQNSQSVGISRFKFMSNGRYESGRATTTTFGNLETTVSSVGDGSYLLSGDEMTVKPNRGVVSKYRVRVYEDYFRGRWYRKMSLLDESANPALNILYDRIEN